MSFFILFFIDLDLFILTTTLILISTVSDAQEVGDSCSAFWNNQPCASGLTCAVDQNLTDLEDFEWGNSGSTKFCQSISGHKLIGETCSHTSDCEPRHDIVCDPVCHRCGFIHNRTASQVSMVIRMSIVSHLCVTCMHVCLHG